MKGRKPTPTHLHIVSGSKNGKGRTREPKPVGDLAEHPDFFSESQREVWNYAIANAPKGLLKKLDRDVLAVWVVSRDIWQKAIIAQAELDRLVALPLTQVTPNGMNQQSAYVGIINKQAVIMMKAASEMGFTPSSRARVSIDPNADDEDDLEKALAG